MSEPLARFAFWLVKDLDLPHELKNGICRVTIPEEHVADLDGRASVAFGVGNSSSVASDEPRDRLTMDDPLVPWLCGRVREIHPETSGAADARPCQDPRSVYEITERLFGHYHVEGGRVHLSGCTLEDEPFLRLTYPARDDLSSAAHLYFTPGGLPLDSPTRQSLGLAELSHGQPSQSQPPESQIDLLVAAGRRAIESEPGLCDVLGIDATDEPLAATIIWVRRVVGKLQFTIADETVEVPFEGWARTLQPPAFICPYTGTQSYNLAACDDGRIAAAEAIEPCGRTGRRVLSTELVTCSVTDLRVLPQFTRTCPVTGKPALQDQFDECSNCHQQVSRVVLLGGVCEGCRSVASVHRDDPRVVWFLGEYPRLSQWGRWKLSETASHYIVAGSRLLGRILIVFDREALVPLYAATRGRFRKSWLLLDPAEQHDLFGERATETPE